MRLHGTMSPYSGRGEGDMKLVDEKGQIQYVVSVMGTFKGVTWNETTSIMGSLLRGIPEGIECSDSGSPRGAAMVIAPLDESNG